MYRPVVTICTTSLTFNNCMFCPHCIYVFCIYLRTNSDLCHLQHKLIGFYNRDEKFYIAVRTGALNKAVCASSLKDLMPNLSFFLLFVSPLLFTFFMASFLPSINVLNFPFISFPLLLSPYSFHSFPILPSFFFHYPCLSAL